MDASFPQTESYLAESPARLEETGQSLYADEQPKKRVEPNVDTHSKLAETVSIENTIMLNPEDLAKVAEKEDAFIRDFNKNFGMQAFEQRMRGARRLHDNNFDNNNVSLPETRTSVIRGMLDNRNAVEKLDAEIESREYGSLRCYEQVERENEKEFVRNRHSLQNSESRIESPTQISEKFARPPISSTAPFNMSSMDRRSHKYGQRNAGYRMQFPPEFGLSQVDERGMQYYDRMPSQLVGPAMHPKGYNPKFNIEQDPILMQSSHADMPTGYRGFAVYEARPATKGHLPPKDSHLSSEQEAFKSNLKSNPSPNGKSNEEETSTKQSLVEPQVTANQRTDVKLDDNKNIKGKRGLGGKDSNTQCPECLKFCRSSSALAKHKATHSDERKYICSICEKGFKRQDHLNGHMLTHRDKKPYQCKYCEKSYCDHRSLKKHYENYHPNVERPQPVSSAAHKTDPQLLRNVKPERRFTPDHEEGRPSPMGLQSKQEVPQGGFTRKRNSDSLCSNSSDDMNKRPKSVSPHMFSDKHSAVSMLKQVMDSHEHNKGKHTMEGYTGQGFLTYAEGFNSQQWFNPYQSPQMIKFMQFGQRPPILVPPGHLGQMNPYCRGDPAQLVPSYPSMNHNSTSRSNEGTPNDNSRRRGDDNENRKDLVVPTDPTSIAIANAKDQSERKVQFKDGSTSFPHVVQWKTVSVGNENNDLSSHSMGNDPSALQLPAKMMAPDKKVKPERPAELNIHIPSSQGEKRSHELLTTTSEHQAKRHCPPPPSPASLNLAEGLLKLADVTFKPENNHDNIFKNPPSTPQRKPRPRPEPINISASNLQFGGPLSPPIYTPPPMLSPHSIFHTPRCAGTPITPGRFFLSGNRSRKNSLDDEGGEVSSDLIIPEPKINIGSQFQANVPSTVQPRSDVMNDKHRAAVCWIPFEHESRQRAQDIEAFLDMACSVAVFGGGSNKEYALHVLYRLKGNIKLAVRHILANKNAIQKGDGLEDYHYEGSQRWSSKERLKFREALDKSGKNFYEISKEIKTKTVQQCVEFYYLWKACRPEGMRSRRGYTEETDSEAENEPEFSDDSETTYIFECDFPECNSKFISRQALNGHIRVHGGSFMKPSEPKRPKVKTTTASSDNGSPSASVSTTSSRVTTKPPRPAKPATTAGAPPVPNSDGTLPEFPCKVCNRMFYKIKSRSAHMKTHVKRNDNDTSKSKS